MMDIEKIKELVEGLNLDVKALELLADSQFVESVEIDKEKSKTLMFEHLKHLATQLANLLVVESMNANENGGN